MADVKMPYEQAQTDLLESIVYELQQLRLQTSQPNGRALKYVAKRDENPTTIYPSTKFPLIDEKNGILKFIWVGIDSDAFELQLTINDEVFTTTLPELVNYVGQNILVDDDWTITYLSSSPTGPPAALRFQSINGLSFDTLQFSLYNTDELNAHSLLRYRYFYMLVR